MGERQRRRLPWQTAGRAISFLLGYAEQVAKLIATIRGI